MKDLFKSDKDLGRPVLHAWLATISNCSTKKSLVITLIIMFIITLVIMLVIRLVFTDLLAPVCTLPEFKLNPACQIYDHFA